MSAEEALKYAALSSASDNAATFSIRSFNCSELPANPTLVMLAKVHKR